jgi:hypothetical protein
MWTPTVEDIWLSNVPPYPMLHIVVNGHDLAIATAGFEGSIVETILNMLGKTQITPDAINALCLMRIDELRERCSITISSTVRRISRTSHTPLTSTFG